MNFCKRCLYPDTKPDLTFNKEGICSACVSYENRSNINWEARLDKFKNLTAYKNKLMYDCIIPVSGGKDSHFQVLKALEYGLHPLAVTATTDSLSNLGRSNLDNINELGVDHIHITTNGRVRRRINNYTLNTIGDISWAEHVTIFTIPIREAYIRGIPLVIWGENPQNEYGGPEADQSDMKPSWLQEFGGLNGLRINDLINNGIATDQELVQYIMPDRDVIENNVKNIFLGHYFPWDGKSNAEIAMEYGFKVYENGVEGTGVTYENLDNYQTGIHDYFKWLKFGFGRATDIACNYIRRGLMSRQQGKEFIWMHDGRFPNTYLGKSLESILDEINMTVDEFMAVCDKFTNLALFEPRKNGMPKPRLRQRIMEVE
jgi:N-acetyl sugar amidotransferase